MVINCQRGKVLWLEYIYQLTGNIICGMKLTERNVKWYLPRDEAEAQEAVQKMLENVGKHMSNFYSNNSEYIKNL